MSTNGGGRTGCLCALTCAYQLMTDPSPEPQSWEQEQNILDQVCSYLLGSASVLHIHFFNDVCSINRCTQKRLFSVTFLVAKGPTVDWVEFASLKSLVHLGSLNILPLNHTN